jgi:urea transporter
MNQTITNKFSIAAEVLKGIGQIMLQENIYTGMLFTLGIFMGSVYMGIAVLSATLIGTLTAKFLKFDKDKITMGLYGFSPALVGASLAFSFKSETIIWAAIIIGASATAIIQHFFIKKNINVFTLPFILVSWILVFLVHHFTSIPPSEAYTNIPTVADIDTFISETNAFGEVIFQNSALSGIIFFIAVYINSPIAALYGFLGATVSSALSLYFHEPIHDVHMGLFSFNAVLCAIVFAGNKKTDGLWVLVSVMACAFINITLMDYNIKIIQTAGGLFTFPFVLSSYVILLFKNFIYKKIACPHN